MGWDDDKQKQMMDFLQPPGMQQGLNTAQAMGIGAPAVGAGGPPPAPTISQKEQPLTSAVDDDEGGYDNQGDEPDAKTVDSHPLAQLPNWVKDQEQQVDKYGPDQQAATMQQTQQRINSPGNILAKGGATFADALMQGVARAGSGGNLAAINERENQNLNRQQEFGKDLNAQNLTGLKEKQDLEKMTSSTPLGASEALATKLLAKDLFPGKSEAEYDRLANNPQSVAKYFNTEAEFRKAIEDMKTRAEFQKESLANQRATIANTASNERLGHTQAAAGVLNNEGFIKNIAELIHPTEGHKALENIVANGGTGGGGQAAPPAQAPFGQTTVRNGKTYEWSPVSGKYHLKQ